MENFRISVVVRSVFDFVTLYIISQYDYFLVKGKIRKFCLALQVAVFGLASRPSFPRDPRDDSCLPNSLVPATFEASLFFSSFVDNLRQEDGEFIHGRVCILHLRYASLSVLSDLLHLLHILGVYFSASTNHSLGFQTAFEMIENMIRRSKGVSIGNISTVFNYTILCNYA